MDEYQSEISPSAIIGLEGKVSKESYGKYLKRLTLRKVHGFTDRTVTFDNVVTNHHDTFAHSSIKSRYAW